MKIKKLDFLLTGLFCLPSLLFADGLNAVKKDISQAKASFNYANLEDAENQLKNLEAKYLRDLADAEPVARPVVQIVEKKKVMQPSENTVIVIEQDEPIIKLDAEKHLSKKIEKQKTIINELKEDKNTYAKNTSSEVLALRSQVSEMRQDLLRAETEVERLSVILEAYNRKELGFAPVKAKTEIKKASIVPAKKPQIKDLPILKVNVDKANLRVGPSKKDSPIMAVAGGSRLVMEKRQGDWYRVIAPNGVRAWIASSVVDFQTAVNKFSPTTTVKVKGYDSNAEARALRLLTDTF